MFIPIWTFYYLLLGKYYSNQSTLNLLTKLDLLCVSFNMLLIDLLYFYNPIIVSNNIITDFINIILIILSQDIYFYTSHKICHLYFFKSIHYIHHSKFDAIYAFYAHPIDHIFVNMFSVVLPYLLFPISNYALTLMVAVQLYGAVSSHSQDLEHQHKLHHLNYTKNLGTIYIIDYMIDHIISKI